MVGGGALPLVYADPNEPFGLVDAETGAGELVIAVSGARDDGRVIVSVATRDFGAGFDEAFVPVELAVFAGASIDADVMFLGVDVRRGVDTVEAVFGEEKLPVFGVIDGVRVETGFGPAPSEFAELPCAVTGAVADDEAGGVGN